MPWEITDQYIRSGHRSPEEFEQNSLRTITLSEDEGIKAVVGKPKGEEKTAVQSYLFEIAKGWTIEKAKAWFEKHQKGEASFTIKVLEKIVDKPLKIRGIALKAGMSRNLNIYTPKELQAFAQKLVSAPVYVEHVAVPNAVGKIVKAEWDGTNLWYEAEIYDDEIAEKIRKGLIGHVSVGADYERIDVVDGKIPHSLHNAELSLVAVPGVPETNIQIMEKLKLREQEFEPIISGEYILGFCQDVSAFLPEHFSTVWLDKENGILALMGRLRAEPQTQRVQSIFFAKEKMWNEGKIRDWLLLHPHYMASAGASAPLQIPLKERGKNGGKGLFERVWTRKYINNLPDSAFAVVYKENGNVVRKFPHHNADGTVDLPHLRNANSRLPQSEIPAEYKRQAMKHLATHKKKLGIGISAEEEKLLEQEGEDKTANAEFRASFEPTVDELIASVEDLIGEIEEAINALTNRIERLENFAIKTESGVRVAEGFLKNSKAVIPVEEAIRIIQNVLPSPMVERSWGLGPQRLCQELRGVILNLRRRVKPVGQK
ncbi:MAG: hypothetical protein ACUVTB_01640 [Candidatus Bathycorpusculaceae bacterium]